jgi:hypothetical protein
MPRQDNPEIVLTNGTYLAGSGTRGRTLSFYREVKVTALQGLPGHFPFLWFERGFRSSGRRDERGANLP